MIGFRVLGLEKKQQTHTRINYYSEHTGASATAVSRTLLRLARFDHFDQCSNATPITSALLASAAKLTSHKFNAKNWQLGLDPIPSTSSIMITAFLPSGSLTTMCHPCRSVACVVCTACSVCVIILFYCMHCVFCTVGIVCRARARECAHGTRGDKT